jgi:hypothetical protein
MGGGHVGIEVRFQQGVVVVGGIAHGWPPLPLLPFHGIPGLESNFGHSPGEAAAEREAAFRHSYRPVPPRAALQSEVVGQISLTT